MLGISQVLWAIFCFCFCLNVKASEFITLFSPQNFEAYCSKQYSGSLSVVKKIRTSKSHVTFIKDGDVPYIVKQTSKASVIKFNVVREALSGYIAEAVDLPACRVRIVPAGTAIVGKHERARPASLLTVVPGRSARFKPKKYKAWIKQDQRSGLNDTVIKGMATHDDLISIVAFDTFTSNVDRHLENYFYDESSDRFFAIDLESSFRDNLAHLACNYIRKLLHSKKLSLTDEQKHALVKYRNRLSKLSDKFPLRTVLYFFDLFVDQAKIKSCRDDLVLQGYITTYKKAISSNLADIKELIKLLDQLFKKLKISRGDFDFERDNLAQWEQFLPVDIDDRIAAYQEALCPLRFLTLLGA